MEKKVSILKKFYELIQERGVDFVEYTDGKDTLGNEFLSLYVNSKDGKVYCLEIENEDGALTAIAYKGELEIQYDFKNVKPLTHLHG